MAAKEKAKEMLQVATQKIASFDATFDPEGVCSRQEM